MPKIATVSDADGALLTVIADRIVQALTSRPDLFRPGRGRTQDFADRYGLMRTTARRILEAEVFPPYTLLPKMAEDIGVNVSWFLGGGKFVDIDQELAGQKEIAVWRFGGYSISVPPGLTDTGADESLIAIAVQHDEYEGFVSRGDIVIAAPVEAPTAGKAMAVIAGSNLDRIILAHVSTDMQQKKWTVQPLSAGSAAETFDVSNVCFGNRTELDPEQVLIVGPICGTLCLSRTRTAAAMTRLLQGGQ